MSNSILKSFIDLVAFDQSLIDLETNITLAYNAVQQLEKQQVESKQLLESYSIKRDGAQKNVLSQEVLVQEIQIQEKKLEQFIDNKLSTKEYEVITKELETLRFNRTTQEQKLVQFVNKVQAVTNECETAFAQQALVNNSLQQQIDQQKEKIQSFMINLSTMEQMRQEKLIGIPENLLSIYETMRGRVVNPVVPIYLDSCSVCFYGLTAKNIQLLRQENVIQCKDCYRFLYNELTK